MARPLTWPYKLALTFLYNKFTWINRPLGPSTALQVVPTAKFCSHFSLDSSRLNGYLTKLHEMGLLQRFEWHSHYFIIEPAAPTGYVRSANKEEVLELERYVGPIQPDE